MKTTKKAARPKPPEELDAEAILEWDRVCDELEQIGRLSTVDRAILTLHCQTWAVWHENMKAVRRHGAVIKWPNGVPGPGPFYKVAMECKKVLRGTLDDLGLTPKARGHEAEEKDDDGGDLTF